jgi:indole-3-glycerol phosphate synthase
MVDEFQVLEARASHADAILLIAAALTDDRMKALRDAALAMELDILCEVHDREELKRAVDLGFTIIGVNSRNLHTMQVQPETQIELGALLPKSAVRVAESGLKSAADLAKMSAAGYSAFLIGESLMREPDPAQALAALLTEQAPALR